MAIATSVNDSTVIRYGRQFLLAAANVAIAVWIFRTLFVVKKIFAAPFAAFSFPLEIEWREGAIWLEAMALRDKISIYDHSVVAYIYLAHGPMDSLLKSWIAAAIPLLSPWQVTRFFVLLLPLALVSCSILLFRQRVRMPWLWGLVVGLTFYVVLLAMPAGYWMLVGRADATAFLLLVVAITVLHYAVHAPSDLVRNAISFVAGIVLASAYLTIWRSVPALGTIFLAAFVAIGIKSGQWRSAFAMGLACFAGATITFLLILFGLLHGSLMLFWDHFYKLFLMSFNNTTPGFLGIPQESWSDFGAGLNQITAEGNTLARACAIIILAPCLLIAACLRPLGDDFRYLRDKRFLIVFLGLYALTVASLLFGYLLYFRAGSLAYFSFIYPLAWYMTCLSLISLRQSRSLFNAGLGFATSGIIWLLAVGGVGATTAGNLGEKLMAQTDAARAFDYALSQLRNQFSVISDDFHFFERHFDNDVIDEGDFTWAFAQGKYFDENFTRTVERYYAGLQQKLPDMIVVSLISAPPIHAMVKHGYRCVVCGVIFQPYDAQGFSLFARDDLPIDDLRAQFKVFASDQTPSQRSGSQ